MKRVPYEVMVNEFERVLTKYGFEPKDAKASAELFAQNSMAGVYSHGLNPVSYTHLMVLHILKNVLIPIFRILSSERQPVMVKRRCTSC